jgi:hypothetical protein
LYCCSWTGAPVVAAIPVAAGTLRLVVRLLRRVADGCRCAAALIAQVDGFAPHGVVRVACGFAAARCGCAVTVARTGPSYFWLPPLITHVLRFRGVFRWCLLLIVVVTLLLFAPLFCIVVTRLPAVTLVLLLRLFGYGCYVRVVARCLRWLLRYLFSTLLRCRFVGYVVAVVG